MLKHASLLFRNSSSEYLVIPVQDFPVLPVGSDISFNLDNKDAYLEHAFIANYEAHSTYGTLIQVELKGNNNPVSDKEIDERWDAIAAVCHPDEGGTGDLVYPKTVPFGFPYPGKPKRAA